MRAGPGQPADRAGRGQLPALVAVKLEQSTVDRGSLCMRAPSSSCADQPPPAAGAAWRPRRPPASGPSSPRPPAASLLTLEGGTLPRRTWTAAATTGRQFDNRALGDVEFDDLLREVLSRVHGVLDEQARLRLLLDAVVTMAADLTLDGVLARIVSIASTLVDAQYAALGVLDVGPERRLRTFVHHGMAPTRSCEIGALPTGHGLLGLLIDDPEPIRLHDIAAHPASYGLPRAPPSDELLPGGADPDPRPGLREPVPDREGGRRRLHRPGRDIVVALAAAAGVAIENARLYEEAGQRQQLAARDCRDHRSSADDLSSAEDALQLVADRAREVSGPTWPGWWPGPTPTRSSCGWCPGPRRTWTRCGPCRWSHSLAAEVVRSGEAVSVPDLGSEPTSRGPLDGAGLAATSARRSSCRWAPGRSRGRPGPGVDPERAAGLRARRRRPARQLRRAGRAGHPGQPRPDDQQRLALFEDRDRIGRDLHDLVIQRLLRGRAEPGERGPAGAGTRGRASRLPTRSTTWTSRSRTSAAPSSRSGPWRRRGRADRDRADRRPGGGHR